MNLKVLEKLTRPVIAKDLNYSFNRLKDPKLGSPGLWALKKYKKSQAENDSIFIIKLKQPFSAFLGILSMKYFSVVPEESIRFYKEKFGKNPVGTGPFKFKNGRKCKISSQKE